MASSFRGARGRFISFFAAESSGLQDAADALAAKRAREAVEAASMASRQTAGFFYGRSGITFRIGGSFATPEAAMALMPQQMLAQLPSHILRRGDIQLQQRLAVPPGKVIINQYKVFIRMDFPQETKTQAGWRRGEVMEFGNDMVHFMQVQCSTSSLGGSRPSDPYDYPHALSGWLRDSFGHRIAQMGEFWRLDVGTIGPAHGEMTGERYFMYLERGTSRMAPRPFARRTLAEFSGGDRAFDRRAAEARYGKHLHLVNVVVPVRNQAAYNRNFLGHFMGPEEST